LYLVVPGCLVVPCLPVGGLPLAVLPPVCPRDAGYPAFGFSPMNHTPVLLHDHDEFLVRNRVGQWHPRGGVARVEYMCVGGGGCGACSQDCVGQDSWLPCERCVRD
jgi:hypothetical protein